MTPDVAERVWVSEPDQAILLRHDEIDEILFGGRKGSGKTDGLLIFQIRRRVKYPGSKGLFLRRNLADLKKEGGAIPRSRELLAGTGAVYREAEHKWRFPGGGVIEFGYLRTDDDVYNYAGSSYDDICITQTEQLTRWQVKILTSALRTTRTDLKPVLRMDANPGGRGHAGLKLTYIDPVPPGTVWIDPKTGRTRMYIAARAQTKHLNPEYRQWLEELPEPYRSAWLDGRWDVFAGQVFARWDPAMHTCAPFPIPGVWPKWMGYDWGMASPSWFGWFARAPWGTIYLYRELYFARHDPEKETYVGTGLTIDEQIRRAKAEMVEGEVAAPCYAGTDLWERSAQSGETNAAVAARGGIPMQQAMTDRVQGWQRIHRALQLRQVDKGGRVESEPELVIFTTCRHIIRTLPELVANPDKPEDVDDGQEDHPCFVAGTLVETGRGRVPIQSVRPGDDVLTRHGYRAVLASGSTRCAMPVVRVRFSNGSLLVGTPDHPVFTTRGRVRLDGLRYGDRMIPCGVRLSSSMVSGSDAIPILRGGVIVSITRQAGVTASGALGASMRKSGKQRTVLSHRGIRSTIETGTHSTTPPRTWKLSRTKPIGQTILSMAIWQRHAWLLRNGMDHRRDGNGTQNTASDYGENVNQYRESVSLAVVPTQRARLGGRVFARTRVNQPLGERMDETMKSVAVQSVGRCSQSTATPIPKRAHEGVVHVSVPAAPAGKATVYNLTVEGVHEYFANGILVANCDGLRYGLSRIPAGRVTAEVILGERRVSADVQW